MNKSVSVQPIVNAICDDIAGMKYDHMLFKALPNGSVQNNIDFRVANFLGDTDEERVRFYRAQERGVIPAGRIKANAGIPHLGTLYNCFVFSIDDTFIGSFENPGIYDTLGHAGKTMGHGGGAGYNFSNIRPSGAPVRDSSGLASGPVAIIGLYNYSGKFVKSAGNRRGAQMAVVNADHPDIFEFIRCKRDDNELKHFNISVGLSDKFLEALQSNGDWELVHAVKPATDTGFGRNSEGLWIYDRVKALDIWNAIMQCTYESAEPGILLLDRINQMNPLSYCELIDATNPCGEQALPPYAACLLGSINLCKYVIDPFTDPVFDTAQFEKDAGILTCMLDKVVDKSSYPLEQQKLEALNKRRIGQGITGLGSMLAMMNIKYSSKKARKLASSIVRSQQTAGFLASVELAKDHGPFPLFDRDEYCSTEYFKTLAPEVQEGIYEHGVRNSHIGSIAPTGTISIAFGENCSSGLEPMFSVKSHIREVTQDDNTRIPTEVMDYAVVKYREVYGDSAELPETFETAMQVSPKDHIRMVGALQRYVCAGISKTVNVPEEIPFKDFKDLYSFAFKKGVKGMTTYRRNPVTGSILSEGGSQESSELEAISIPGDSLFSLESISPKDGWNWKDEIIRPTCANSYTYYVKHPSQGSFALTVCSDGDRPFEVWASGDHMPRNLGAICMTLSQDMSLDPAWSVNKLKSFAKTKGPDAFDFEGPDGETWHAPSLVAAVSKLILHRFNVLGVDIERTSEIEHSMFLRKEPKTRSKGGMSYYYDVFNPSTGDDFSLFVKEVKMPDGRRRPISVWADGTHNPTLTGLVMSLSLDMRVYDAKWIQRKLTALLRYSEAQGDFMSFVPGDEERQINYSSTVAYVGAILLNRYTELNLFDDESQMIMGGGGDCPGCDRRGTYVPTYGGCKECTACGYSGDCG